MAKAMTWESYVADTARELIQQLPREAGIGAESLTATDMDGTEYRAVVIVVTGDKALEVLKMIKGRNQEP